MTPTEINKTNELMTLISKLETELKRLNERLNNAAKHSKMLEARIAKLESSKDTDGWRRDYSIKDIE